MKKTAAFLALACAVALVACARRTVEGRWHLQREATNMPAGFNLKGESFLEITRRGDGIDLRDFVSSPETGASTLMDRHYPLDGTERALDSSGERTLYVSARLEGPTLFTQERIVDRSPGARAPQVKTSVTYVVSWNGMRLTGTDERGNIATYERQ